MQKNIAQSNKASGNIICDDIVVRNRFIGKEVITSTSIVRKSITSEQLNDVTTAGSFTSANITVGSDGRITSAVNGNGGSSTIPEINSVAVSNVSPKTTVDIAGSIASGALFHVVYIVASGTANRIFSDQTPSTAAPAFSVPLNTVTFTNYKMAKGDRVFHVFYTAANISSGILVAYIDYLYQSFTFVRPGPVTGPSSIPWNGSNWDYYFTTISDRQIITSAAVAIAYINDPELSFADGYFTGLSLGSVAIIDDIGCYTTPVDSMGVPVNAFVMKWFIGEIDGDIFSNVNMDITGTNWIVNWGDPDNTTENSTNQFSYNSNGEYYVTLWADKLLDPITIWSPNSSNIVDVLHWGDIGLLQLSLNNSYIIRSYTADDIPATTITNMDSFFSGCDKIQPDVSNWDVSNVTIMSFMFSVTQFANPDVSNWDVSNVTDMSYMFSQAEYANPDVSNWDVSNVTNMARMFQFAPSANPDVSNWNVSNVTNMLGMFFNTTTANPDVSNWNTGNVTNMSFMFTESDVANPNVSNWNVSNVINMQLMFYGALVANPDISNWTVSGLPPNGASSMFNNAPQFTTTNYDNALVTFAAQILNANSWSNVIPPKTTATGLPAYNFLVGTRGWTITDGGTI